MTNQNIPIWQRVFSGALAVLGFAAIAMNISHLNIESVSAFELKWFLAGCGCCVFAGIAIFGKNLSASKTQSSKSRWPQAVGLLGIFVLTLALLSYLAIILFSQVSLSLKVLIAFLALLAIALIFKALVESPPFR